MLLPTAHVSRWINEIGDRPNSNEGLYGLACSVDKYCGVIAPWGTPLLIFGDDPADIYCRCEETVVVLFRWIAADSFEQLSAVAMRESRMGEWEETTSFEIVDGDLTLMDTCTYDGDPAPRIRIQLPAGGYKIQSRRAECTHATAIVHRLEPSERGTVSHH